jgi:EmrB/QacA subfamily drug resistance transporter
MPEPRRPHHWITLALLAIAGISFAVMQTLVIPALPFFKREFGASQADTTWIVTGFLLSSSVLTPLLGKLGDTHGKKRMLVFSLGVFGLGSLGAAAADSLEWVVACRVLQGTGAAVFPLAFGIIRDEFPADRVGLAVGVVSSVFGAGGGIGLVSSGFILEHLSWHWLFLLGAAPVLVACVLIAVWVPESPVRRGGRPDWLGAVLLSVALVSLLLAVTKGEAWGWGSWPVLSLFAVAACVFRVWLRVEQRVAEPLVDLTTFARRGMAATNAATMLVGFAMTAFFVLMPAFVQVDPGGSGYGFSASAVEAGLFFIPCSLAMIVCGPLAGSLGTRYGHESALRFGLAFTGVALLLLAFAHDEAALVLVWMGVLGIGVASALSALGSLVIANSRASETGVASGVNLITRTIGAAIGAQVAAAVISAHTPAGSLVPDEAGFTIAFALAGGAAALALVPATLLGGRSMRLRRLALNPA